MSIVVPVFNGEKYLRESLDSILTQSYPRTEILVMDDASTDRSRDIATSYGENIRYHRQPENKGQFDNVNDGILIAQGDYIAVFHADDVYSTTIVESEVAFLERYPNAGAVFSHDIFIDAAGREYGRLKIPPELCGGRPLEYSAILNALLKYKNTFLVGPSAMVRAAVYREVGLYRGREYRIASDLEMWVRIARKYSVGILEDYLMSYRHGHGNATQNYYYLRTEPEGHFSILDACLLDGGRFLTTAEAIKAHEAHRAEDQLMLAVNHYIRSEQSQARAVLGSVRTRQLLASNQIQYGRLLILLYLLKVLVRLPRLSLIATLFYRRWHVKKFAKQTS